MASILRSASARWKSRGWRRGAPKSIEELRDHSRLLFSSGSHRSGWRLERGEETARIDGPARLRVNNSYAVRDAALRGLGTGQLPPLIAAEALRRNKLARVLPDWQPTPVPVHAVFPSNRYLTPKVRAFIDLAVARFPSVKKKGSDPYFLILAQPQPRSFAWREPTSIVDDQPEPRLLQPHIEMESAIRAVLLRLHTRTETERQRQT